MQTASSFNINPTLTLYTPAVYDTQILQTNLYTIQ